MNFPYVSGLDRQMERRTKKSAIVSFLPTLSKRTSLIRTQGSEFMGRVEDQPAIFLRWGSLPLMHL